MGDEMAGCFVAGMILLRNSVQALGLSAEHIKRRYPK
jgi:hypothetical protein